MVRLCHHRNPDGNSSRTRILQMLIFLLVAAFHEVTTEPTSSGQSISPPVENISSKNAEHVTKNVKNNNTGQRKLLKDDSIDSSASATILNRISRALPRFENAEIMTSDEAFKNLKSLESIQKTPTKSDSIYVIPYLRPGRSSPLWNKREDSMIPMLRFGRSDSMIPHLRFGKSINYFDTDKKRKHDTIIPMARFGRGNNFADAFLSGNSEIDLEMAGLTDNGNEIVVSEGDSLPVINVDGSQDSLDLRSSPEYTKDGVVKDETASGKKKRKLNENDTMIPYPRPGRSTVGVEQNVKVSNPEFKRQASEFVIPQMRFGRSVTLLSKPKVTLPPNEDFVTYVLPYPRPGRSAKVYHSGKDLSKLENIEKMNVMLPYPRPGRYMSDVELQSDFYFDDSKGKRQDYMLPYARLGRSVSTILSKPFGAERDGLDNQMQPLFSKVNTSHQRLNLKDLIGNTEDLDEKGSLFIIPYPRPGKRYVEDSPSAVFSEYYEEDQSEQHPEDSSSVNRRSGTKSKLNLSKPNTGSDMKADHFIVPYPRPGRSQIEISENLDFDTTYDSSESETFSEDHQQIVKRSIRSLSNKDIPILAKSAKNPNKRRSLDFVVPYPRFGRDQKSNKDFMIPYARLGKKRSGDMLPYPRPGRSSPAEDEYYVLPYPRPGRSVIPYPRPGNENALKRSDSILPYPRPGRSVPTDYVLPYPRTGRSHSKDENSQELYVLPYPRPGRSETSNFVLPYPRPGRSFTKNELNKLKSNKGVLSENTILPYPRPGRSTNKQGFVVPYPRLGRSDHTHRTENETTLSETVIPYPRLGRSENIPTPKPHLPEFAHNLDKHMFPGNSHYLLPYPRPGRYIQ